MCERLSEVVCRRCIEVGSDASRMGRRRGGFLVWSMRSRFSWFSFGLEFRFYLNNSNLRTRACSVNGRLCVLVGVMS